MTPVNPYRRRNLNFDTTDTTQQPEKIQKTKSEISDAPSTIGTHTQFIYYQLQLCDIWLRKVAWEYQR